MSLTVTARFDAKFTPEPNTGCWLWHGARNEMGYGWFWTGKKYSYAHRFSYEQSKGKISDGNEVDHLCRVRECVNPDHLESVLPRVNTLRSENACAQNARKTHCIRGHELTEDNVYVWNGRRGRSCRRCHTENERVRRAKGKV